MNANTVYQSLKNDFWLKEVALKTFPFITKMTTPPVFSLHSEITVRIATNETTRFGKPKPQRRRFDAIALVKPFYSAYGNDLFTVGFEIKVNKNDLINDEKFKDYMGFTDFFFFVVPQFLVNEVINKSAENKCIGVIDIETKTIVKMPERQQNNNIYRVESLLRQIAFNRLN